MKTIAAFFIFLISFSILAAAQDDDDWASRKYDIENFSKIYLYGGYKVYLTQGKKPGLIVKTSDEDVLDNLKVENRGDELRLVMKEDFITYKRIRLYITFTELEAILAKGGLKLETDGYLDIGDLDMQIEGGANINLQMKADEVKVTGEGGVLIELDGVASSLMVKLSGAGHLDAKELRTEEVHVEIEGVGTGSVHATEKLFAKIEGVGKITYKGNPRVIKEIEGLGSVKSY